MVRIINPLIYISLPSSTLNVHLQSTSTLTTINQAPYRGARSSTLGKAGTLNMFSSRSLRAVAYSHSLTANFSVRAPVLVELRTVKAPIIIFFLIHTHTSPHSHPT